MSSSTLDSARKSLVSEPAQAISAAVMAVMALAALNQLSVWFAPLLLLASVVGMGLVVVFRSRAERIAKEGEKRVDYHKLSAIDTDGVASWLKDNLRGHDQIVDSILQSLKKSTQLARPGRTLGNFLLVGPTGTGKTYLAQLIAAGLYPKSEVVLLTMNQYKQSADVYTLIGPPPGMPGYEVGGRLTRPVMQDPYRVVILDELEKSHHDLHDCLYDILDTATCREKSSGQLVDFSACVFFGTCNAGVDQLRALAQEFPSPTSSAWLGRSRDVLADAAKFDRAFLSRWDGIFLMDHLLPLHVAEVACLQLCRYWRDYGIEVQYAAPELILEAVQRNQDFSEYGVRQLARFIREQTEPAILEAKRNGSKKVNLHVSGQSGGLEVEVAR
ncbi:MAG TPA: AAA family ATPase [Pirellulales bacterium]|jgi:ATP-dependent Clp protease ATP-binding subunit ClpC|nr:AAA family ATPase [Pirellulales bacterium]